MGAEPRQQPGALRPAPSVTAEGSPALKGGGDARFPIRIETDHYVVWGQRDREGVERAAATAEALYTDFMETFRGRMRLDVPRRKFPIVCMQEDLVTQDASGRRYALPGIYQSWSGIAAVRLDRASGPLDENPARVRHEAAHQLMAATFGIRSSPHDRGFWYTEGMACYFEGTGQFRLNGSVRVSRLAALEQIFARSALPDFDEVLALDDDRPEDRTLSVRAYALAWSVCHFLIHANKGIYRDRLFACFENLRDWNLRPRDDDLVRRVLGDAEELNREWQRHVHLLARGPERQIVASLAPIGSQAHRPLSPAEANLLPSVPAEPIPEGISGPASAADVVGVWNRIRSVPAFPEGEWARVCDELRLLDGALPAAAWLLRHGSDEQRRRAATALGWMNAREALGLLVDVALRGQTAGTRRSAAEAIGRMNHGIAPYEFYRWVPSGQPARAVPAIEALGIIGDTQAVGTLLHVLRRSVSGTGGLRMAVSRPSGGEVGPSGRGAASPPGVQIGWGAGRNTESGATIAQAAMAALKSITGARPGDAPADWLAWAEAEHAFGPSPAGR